MSAFEDFVQLELPKRPYLNTDVSQEDVIVRRGAGPRQLAGVTLSEGQVLGKVGGVLTGVSIGAGATFKKYTQTFSASTDWVVEHNQNSTVYLVQAFGADGKVIIPDEIVTTDADTITVEFNSAQAGRVTIVFLE